MTETHQRPAQDKVCGYEYTVRRGDSFYLIAHRLGVPLRDLLEANADVNPARLMVGDVLCIPMEEDDAPQVSPPTPAPEPEMPSQPETDDSLDQPAAPEESATCAEGQQHTIDAGETISDIQLRANLNRHTLETANPQANLDELTQGQVLCIPKANIACDAATHILGQDETLESVSLQWNVSVGALLRANPCLAPSDFTAGVCINLPTRG